MPAQSRNIHGQVVQTEREERTGYQVGHGVFFFFFYKAPGHFSWGSENAEKMFGVVSHVDAVKVSTTTVQSSL